MPHAVVSLSRPIDEILSAFEPFQQAGPTEDVHVGFKGVYRSGDGDSLLVETYVREQPHDQRIGLVVSARADGEYIVKLHDIGFPRATTGAHLAVGLLAGWLLTLSADARIEHHNLRLPAGQEPAKLLAPQ